MFDADENAIYNKIASEIASEEVSDVLYGWGLCDAWAGKTSFYSQEIPYKKGFTQGKQLLLVLKRVKACTDL